jgi:glycosyltransferase involved in cell wall biosynthesis
MHEVQLPRLSVLLPVYNAESWVGEAIASIIGQTYSEFELIVVDDGSTDRSAEVIRSFRDDRIRFVSRENRGFAASLNEGLALARADLIARHDADDVSKPERFRKQVDYLDRNPDTVLLGTNYEMIDVDGKSIGTTNLFTNPGDLKIAQVFSNQFCHGSVVFRRSVALQAGGYRAVANPAEDYDLFARLARDSRVANLSESLYRWRVNPSGMSISMREAMDDQTRVIREREFSTFVARRSPAGLFSSFHPFSVRRGPVSYLDQKGTMLRLAAFMYTTIGMKRNALMALAFASLYEPWRRRNYRAMRRVLRGHLVTSLIELEAMNGHKPSGGAGR